MKACKEASMSYNGKLTKAIQPRYISSLCNTFFFLLHLLVLANRCNQKCVNNSWLQGKTSLNIFCRRLIRIRWGCSLLWRWWLLQHQCMNVGEWKATASSTESAQARIHMQCQTFGGSTHIEVSTVKSSGASSNFSSCTGSGLRNWIRYNHLLLCHQILQAFLTSPKGMSVGCWACQGATCKTICTWTNIALHVWESSGQPSDTISSLQQP